MQDDGFNADSAAEVVFYSEVPLDAETFNANGATFRQAISEVAGGASVSIANVEAVPASTFTRRRRSRVGVSTLEASTFGAESVVRQSEAPECSAPLPPQGECTRTKCTSPDAEGGVDCWAGNGEPYSCEDGYDSYELTGETVEWDGQMWNEYTCCNAPMSVVVVETTVMTTFAEIDRMWDKLNEHDINVKMREKCLPPAVIKYGELGEDEDEGGAIVAGIMFAIFVGVISICIAVCCCRQVQARKQQQQRAGPTEMSPDAIPGAVPGAMGVPTADMPVQASAVPVAQVASPGEMTRLPPGWSKAVDPASGREYYQNDYTQVTQWDRPSA